MPPFVPGTKQYQVITEGARVLALCGGGEHSSADSVQRAEHGHALVLSGRRDEGLFSDRRPHAAEAGVQVELAFVLEEEDVGAGTPFSFFKAASRARRTRFTSRLFCRCLSESLGRL